MIGSFYSIILFAFWFSVYRCRLNESPIMAFCPLASHAYLPSAGWACHAQAANRLNAGLRQHFAFIYKTN